MTFPVATLGSGGQRCDLLKANQTGMLPVTVADVGVQDLKRMALRGGLAKLTSMAGNLALRFGFIIVAARLLEPEDFGLVAMVTVVTAMFASVCDRRLSLARSERHM